MELAEKLVPSIVLLILPPERYAETNLDIVRHLVRSHECVYVSVNRPAHSLLEDFAHHDIARERVFFIDLVTRQVSDASLDNCVFLQSASSLTELSIALSEALRQLSSACVHVDSLSTLVTYNAANLVVRFTHHLIGKLRVLGAKGVFISLKKGVDDELIAQLAPFCDAVAEL